MCIRVGFETNLHKRHHYPHHHHHHHHTSTLSHTSSHRDYTAAYTRWRATWRKRSGSRRWWWLPAARPSRWQTAPASTSSHTTTSTSAARSSHLLGTPSRVDPALLTPLLAGSAAPVALQPLPQLRLHNPANMGPVLPLRLRHSRQLFFRSRPPLAGGSRGVDVVSLAMGGPGPWKTWLVGALCCIVPGLSERC